MSSGMAANSVGSVTLPASPEENLAQRCASATSWRSSQEESVRVSAPREASNAAHRASMMAAVVELNPRDADGVVGSTQYVDLVTTRRRRLPEGCW